MSSTLHTLADYEPIVGSDVIEEIRSEAEKLAERKIVMVNSTFIGGGVAEMLHSIAPLMNEAGARVEWRVLHGIPDFYRVTKKIHNALQGEEVELTEEERKLYFEVNRRYSTYTYLDEYDLVVIHDPQPLPLIKFYRKKQPWVFRCHIDCSTPNPSVWRMFKELVERYDHIVVSKEEYKRDIAIPFSVIPPAIDPLSPKNVRLSDDFVERYLNRHGVELDKPVISQVSRFDKWKDPLGVIKVFEKVREKENCRLVLLGSLATDDPEGEIIYRQVKQAVERSRYKNDITILLIHDDVLVNALQTASAVVIQKSIREGFGLVVAEALWKGTPVVASRVGGIPL